MRQLYETICGSIGILVLTIVGAFVAHVLWGFMLFGWRLW